MILEKIQNVLPEARGGPVSGLHYQYILKITYLEKKKEKKEKEKKTSWKVSKNKTQQETAEG